MGRAYQGGGPKDQGLDLLRSAIPRCRHWRLSYQILQEYYVTLTTKLDPPRSTEDARDDVGALRAWNPVGIDHHTIEAAWDVQDRFGYSSWDALIVAAALQSGCRYLLTEDLQTGQVIDTITIISPFEQDPKKILTGL